MQEQLSMTEFLELCKSGEIDVTNAKTCYNSFKSEYEHYIELVEKQFLKRIGYKIVIISDPSFLQ